MKVFHRTTIHLPISLVQKIDEAARIWGSNRNQSIISLLEMALSQDSQAPSGSTKQFLDSKSVDSGELSSGFDSEETPAA